MRVACYTSRRKFKVPGLESAAAAAAAAAAAVAKQMESIIPFRTGKQFFFAGELRETRTEMLIINAISWRMIESKLLCGGQAWKGETKPKSVYMVKSGGYISLYVPRYLKLSGLLCCKSRR